MIDRNTQVVGVPPRISPEKFEQVLIDAGSPAAPDGFDMYAVAIANKIDPCYLLAFFKHESGFGLLGVCHDYETRSPGNTRTSRIGVNSFVAVPGKGQYVKYSTWAAGANDACTRLSDPYFVYARRGAVTIGEILPIWAPTNDNNSPDAYITSVCNLMNSWIDEESSSTMTLEIIDLSNNTPSSVYTDRGFPISELILHDTAGSSDFNNKSTAELTVRLNATIQWFQGSGGVSIHYLIGPEALGGKIYRLCKEQFAAYHAVGNKGSVNGVSKDNRISIGIERFGQPNESVGPNQKASMLALAADICQRNGLSANQVISHMSIQSDRTDGNVLLAAVRNVVTNGGSTILTTNTHTPLPQPASSNKINGRVLAGGFRAFYDKLAAVSPNFQLLVLGLPVSDEFDCDVDGNGKNYTVQLFERSALVYEAANAAPWDIHPVTTAQLDNVLAAAKAKSLTN